MGPSSQQGPFSPGAFGRLLVPEPLPRRLQRTGYTTRHHDLGLTSWYTVRAGERSAPQWAWQHIDLPARASELQARVAFAWPDHRIDIRQASRRLVVRHGDRIVADARRPVVLYESGFAPRCYVVPADIDQSALIPVEHQTFCPYEGLCSPSDIGDARLAAWSHREASPEVGRISGLVSFETDMVSVQLDRTRLLSGAGSDGNSARPRSRTDRCRGAPAPRAAISENP